jgi:hypothetical protein
MGTASISKKTKQKAVENALISPDIQVAVRDMMIDWMKNNPAAMRDTLLNAFKEAGYEVKPINQKVDYRSEEFAKKHAVKWEHIQQLQELFKDEPPAEEILRIMRPEKYLKETNI